MKLLAVNYHYIGDESAYRFPGIFPTSPSRLVEQIRAIGKFFEYIDGQRLLDAVAGTRMLPENACVLTFDDGLKEQHEEALPILDREGVPALFFICGMPHEQGRAMAVHKLHHVRAHTPPDELLHEFEIFMKESDCEACAGTDADRAAAAATYRYDDDASALMKWYLNFKLDRTCREEFVDRCFSRIVPDEKRFCVETYMDSAALQCLASRGCLGNHTYHHFPLARLASDDASFEIERNRLFIKKTTGTDAPFISYPYGGQEAVSLDTAGVSHNHGIAVGFTMERALNRSLLHPGLFARVDTNDAPGGRRPLMKFQHGDVIVSEAMAPARTRYFSEPPV